MDAPDVNNEVWDEMQAFDLGLTSGDVVYLDSDDMVERMQRLIGSGVEEFADQFDTPQEG